MLVGEMSIIRSEVAPFVTPNRIQSSQLAGRAAHASSSLKGLLAFHFQNRLSLYNRKCHNHAN